MTRFAYLLLILAALLVLAAPVAAKRPKAIAAVTPDTVHVGDVYTVSGTAPLWADGVVKVGLCNPGCWLSFAVSGPDFSFSSRADYAGLYVVETYAQDAAGHIYVTFHEQFEVVAP